MSMNKLSNITNIILKKKTIQRAKNLITRLSLLNQENNAHSLKNELFQFFSEKDNCEEEKYIKQTISLIFKEELIKIGFINENNNNQSNQGKESAEKNLQEKIIKNNNTNHNNRNRKYNKKKITQNERLDDIVKKIENDGGPKSHIINKLKEVNNIIYSYFIFDADKLSELSDYSIEKLLTMLCLFYPFFTKEQKNQIDNSFVLNVFKGSSNFNKLYSSILINNKTNIIPNILNSLVKEIISDKDILSLQQEIEFDIVDLNLDNQELIGHQIYLKNYQFYILCQILKNNSYTKIDSLSNKIIFKLQLILYSIYLQTKKYPYNLIHDCILNRIFFKKIMSMKKFDKFIKIEKNYDGDGNDNYMWENYSLISSALSKKKILKIKDLFSEKQVKRYNYCLYQVRHFYAIDNTDIISCRNGGSNFNFLLNFYEGVNYINNYKYKIPVDKYKNILTNLEKEIFELVKDNYYSNTNKENEFSSFKTYQKFKDTYNELNKILHDKFKERKFNLFPYGSIAKLNCSSSSDLDCFLKIDTDDKDIIVSFFEDLVKFIKEEIDNTLEEPTISARLCVINFTFNDISIDLNIVGYTPYLHSVLFRIYNLLDARFSMLVLCIKYIIKEIGLKTISGETSFLNSFSWEMLIKAFLQDIIKPPILPKLIENSDQNKIREKFGKLFFNTEAGKNLKNFINDMYSETIMVPNLNFKKAKKIYDENIKIKNDMPCSELLLKFLFFVIFIFKGDSIYVNNTKEKEGFENIIGIFKPKNIQDKKFRYYFRTKYRRFDAKKRIKKEGIFVFRDPYDTHYNPGQSLKESHEDIFYQKLKKAFYKLMETGSLKDINKSD